MQRRTLLGASALALLALAKPLAAQDGMSMGYTAIDLTNPYFIALTDGMQARADELGIALTIHDGKSDPASQVSAIENFVVQQMDAILASPVDPQALEPLVEQIHAASIPLISVAQGVPGSDAFLGLDEREYGLSIGRIAGQYIVDNMGGQAEVAILTYPELAPVILRGEGIRDGILEVAPEAVVVAEQSAATPRDGRRRHRGHHAGPSRRPRRRRHQRRGRARRLRGAGRHGRPDRGVRALRPRRHARGAGADARGRHVQGDVDIAPFDAGRRPSTSPCRSSRAAPCPR
jgi:hypothetical protein